MSIVETVVNELRIFSCTVCKKTSGPPNKGKRWDHSCRVIPDGCQFLGGPLEGESVACQGCSGSPRVHQIFGCSVHGKCVYLVKAGLPTEPPVANCRTCRDYKLPENPA